MNIARVNELCFFGKAFQIIITTTGSNKMFLYKYACSYLP